MVEHVVKPFQDHLVFLALCSCGLSLARKVSCDREYVEHTIGAISNNIKQSPQVARFPWMCCNRCFFAFSQKLQNATRQKIQLTAVACGHSTSRKRVSSTKASRDGVREFVHCCNVQPEPVGLGFSWKSQQNSRKLPSSEATRSPLPLGS